MSLTDCASDCEDLGERLFSVAAVIQQSAGVKKHQDKTAVRTLGALPFQPEHSCEELLGEEPEFGNLGRRRMMCCRSGSGLQTQYVVQHKFTHLIVRRALNSQTTGLYGSVLPLVVAEICGSTGRPLASSGLTQ